MKLSQIVIKKRVQAPQEVEPALALCGTGILQLSYSIINICIGLRKSIEFIRFIREIDELIEG